MSGAVAVRFKDIELPEPAKTTTPATVIVLPQRRPRRLTPLEWRALGQISHSVLGNLSGQEIGQRVNVPDPDKLGKLLQSLLDAKVITKTKNNLAFETTDTGERRLKIKWRRMGVVPIVK